MDYRQTDYLPPAAEPLWGAVHGLINETDPAHKTTYRPSLSEARASLSRYIDGFCNARRPHSSLDRQTPDEAYFTALP